MLSLPSAARLGQPSGCLAGLPERFSEASSEGRSRRRSRSSPQRWTSASWGQENKHEWGSCALWALPRLSNGSTQATSFVEDGFFEEGEAGRSDAEEVWESLLSKCQRDAAERKLPYMAHLFASLAFEELVGLDMAHQVIFEAERLSYRQLCILKLFAVEGSLSLRSENYRGEAKDRSSFPRELYLILHESFGLYRRELVANSSGSAALNLFHIPPEAMRTQGLGMDIHELMQLSRMPDDDIAIIVEQLRLQTV